MTDSPADVNAAVSEENGTNARSDSEVDLTVLLVSGNRKTFRFQQDTTIAHVRNYVYSNWPEEWSSEQPANVESLRIVFLGKFLEDKTTLQENKITPEEPRIVHFIIKARAASVKSGSNQRQSPSQEEKCCCACTIM